MLSAGAFSVLAKMLLLTKSISASKTNTQHPQFVNPFTKDQ